ncbi:Energy-dependent translational throttle protein EttA [Saezia sanguinis]|uniref:Energy-dependent translational throttle protein EttA n=1 Tax=Saezia sanguinis TaxID=1965230 RepID=A0A433SHR7_9BURK|nr:Energy-dependent translational throttle protein EttA [Saezia sanguinis]
MTHFHAVFSADDTAFHPSGFALHLQPANVPLAAVCNHAATPWLELKHINLTLSDGRVLFNDANASFHISSSAALVGPNGAGKSLLLQIMAGLLQPSGGKVMRMLPVVYIPQNMEAPSDWTVADMVGLTPMLNALTHIEQGRAEQADFDLAEGYWELLPRMQAQWLSCSLPDLAMQMPAAMLSAGERIKVVLCAAFASQAGALILDEPTNHLDRDARYWLYQKLDSWTGGIVVASHDRDLLSRVQNTVEIGDTRLKHYGGNYAFYEQQSQAEMQRAVKHLEQAKCEKKRVERELRKQHDQLQRQIVRENAKAKVSNHSGLYLSLLKESADHTRGRKKRQLGQMKAQVAATVQKAAQQVQADRSVFVMLPESQVPAGKQICQLDELKTLYPAGNAPLSMTLNGPARVGVVGPNGCGKSVLMKTLAGWLMPASGACHVGVPFVWFDQMPEKLLPGERSVLEQLKVNRSPVPESQLRMQLAQLGLDAVHVHLPAAQLSGGQWLKAALACALWVENAPQLLLLDEPTNHLDLWALRALEGALSAFPGAMLVASHDRLFLETLKLTHMLSWSEDRWMLNDA